MSKRFISINGNDFTAMVLAGADNLRRNVDRVNGLNVFPVPDGDTGTNMNLTITSGVEELKKKPSSHIGKAAEALSKGLLMGARGNSGVILSQLFRGFAKHVHDLESVNVQQFASALQQGVETAYKAVVKPVEGTILTVSKEAAKHAMQYKRSGDLLDLMQEVLDKANEALARTPEQLPVLKQVGVVDAGGQGLVCVYEGFVAALNGSDANDDYAMMDTKLDMGSFVPVMNLAKEAHAHLPAQAHLATEDIEFGYCTEFMLTIQPGKVKGQTFNEGKFRNQLSKLGDSLLVVADEELVKVHIHAEYPGEVMNQAMRYGALSRIKIENMRDQHSHILEDYTEAYATSESAFVETVAPAAFSKPYGFVAVALGDGITDILSSVGVDVVLSGGQTMNPSTEDIVNAVNRIDAQTIFVLPNNSNIILAAQQAVELVEEKVLVVIPSKSIPQGLAAILAFQENVDAQANAEAMKNSLQRIKSGQVTYAVRDTNMDGIEIKQGHFIGIQDGRIVSSQPNLIDACKKLLEEMIEEGNEIVTILTGEDAKEEETEELEAFIQTLYPDMEVELHPGGQPLYAYLFSVE
ncbi:DAK2 domain-containing protein [Paenibacillus sp. SYP-B3998]|uniref:DAK2 domain-containing protein n=1 Tax=Paenibacillus sp. SYP-B3998 TaxID=2678564 RepID=A0A6G3ZTE5_9BACL|nr:DAK2 domain-containing protein [Paenibacillus sp. SYP-B3998]NEW05473.1 DAK2 domain-containing protein [Paenibacillus sp. SYP-B3998]